MTRPPPSSRLARLFAALRPQASYSARTPGYEQYMRSDRWRRKKGEFRKWWETNKGPYRCWARWCFHKDALDVHHMDYDRFGDECHTDLVPLCRKHHNRVTTAWTRERSRRFGPRRSLRTVTVHEVRAFFPNAARGEALGFAVALGVLAVLAKQLLA